MYSSSLRKSCTYLFLPLLTHSEISEEFMCKLQNTFVGVFIIFFNLDFSGILCSALCYEQGRNSNFAIIGSSPSCTPHPCGMLPNQGSSIHFHHFRVKNKSRHTEKLYLFFSPVSHVTDTLFVKTWGGKSYAKSVACEQIPSDISITHAVPCKTTSLESCGKELNGATTEHRDSPLLPSWSSSLATPSCCCRVVSIKL